MSEWVAVEDEDGNHLTLLRLTYRESQVAARIIEGMTNEAIAEDLGVSFGTIRTHRHRIYRKLRVSVTHKENAAVGLTRRFYQILKRDRAKLLTVFPTNRTRVANLTPPPMRPRATPQQLVPNEKFAVPFPYVAKEEWDG